MDRSFEQGLLKYLSALAIVYSSGVGDPGPSLLQVPTDLVSDALNEGDEVEWSGENHRRMLCLLAQDPRAAVREQVAGRVVALWNEAPADAERLLRRLAQDRSRSVRVAAGLGVERMIAQASPIESFAIVSDWALSANPNDRAALAAALRGPTPLPMRHSVLQALSNDSNPRVRRLALDAAQRHFEEAPPRYAEVAARLVNDPDRTTRHRARSLVRRVARSATPPSPLDGSERV